MKNFLVPTDFSDCSRAAEDIGLEIAKKANAEIHFLHIINTPVTWVETESLVNHSDLPILSVNIYNQ